ncbi:c6 zinc finger domain-containing protein, partial [Colletotrichum incanum]
LTQLRTGMARLNWYLHQIGAAASEQYGCGQAAETVEHFFFRCTQWTAQCATMLQRTDTHRSNMSFYLCGKAASDPDDWSLCMDVVTETVKFAMATGRLDMQINQTQDKNNTKLGRVVESYFYLMDADRALWMIMHCDVLAEVDLPSPTYLLLRQNPNRLHATLNNVSAKDSVNARLQAKYWGAQAILNTEKIRMVLDNPYSLKQRVNGTMTTLHTAEGPRFLPQDSASPGTGHGLPVEIIEEAGRGISALFKSIEAVHDLNRERLLVTNIFGRAHGQWGNLLVLAAAYRDPHLAKFVDESHLKELFDRTIEMLGMHAQLDSALMTDRGILESIKRDIFSPPTVPEGRA